jgi:hypothetical protein
MLGVPAAAHRQPCRVHPVVSALVPFADVIPADRRVGIGAGFSGLPVGDAELEGAEAELRAMMLGPETIGVPIAARAVAAAPVLGKRTWPIVSLVSPIEACACLGGYGNKSGKGRDE